MTRSYLPVVLIATLLLAVPDFAVCDDAAPAGKAKKKGERAKQQARHESEREEVERARAELAEQEERRRAEREERTRIEHEHHEHVNERENRRHHLIEAAEHLELAGKHEMAQDLRREVEEMERERHAAHDPGRGDVPRGELEELRQMLRKLGEAVERLHRRVDELEHRR